MSERIMNQYGVGQDEFIFRMYSIALVAIIGAAGVKGDLLDGMAWILQPGTYDEQVNNVPLEQRSWSPAAKMALMALFSSMGFFGSSCAAAITKQFGALSMSITSTARKATTLFLSFLLFDNECTSQHIVGIVVFISALTAKSVRRKGKKRRDDNNKERRSNVVLLQRGISDLEIGIPGGSSVGEGIGRISRVSSGEYESGEEITVVSMDSRTSGGGPGRRNVSSAKQSPNGRGGAPDNISRPRYAVV
jgi:UAA transporter family